MAHTSFAWRFFDAQEVQSKFTNAEMISAFCDRILKTGGCVRAYAVGFPCREPLAHCCYGIISGCTGQG